MAGLRTARRSALLPPLAAIPLRRGRNHPGFIEYLKKPVRFAVEEMHADLVHFDNFGTGAASYDAFSKQKFREFAGSRPHAPRSAASGCPQHGSPGPRLGRVQMPGPGRSLRRHVAIHPLAESAVRVECNPGGVSSRGAAAVGIDHARLLPLGNAFWDEQYGADWSAKTATAQTRIRTLKVGELFHNSTFLYCESVLDLAESMAFNVNCLGSICWFEWGRMESAHLTGKPLPKELKTYIRFFLRHQDLYRHWPSVADVAVLRTFADANFSPRKYYPVEQGLIQGHVAWRIIFDEQLDHLAGYRVLVVPERPWLTAEQERKIDRFSRQGGRVVRSADIRHPEAFPETVRDDLRVVAEALAPWPWSCGSKAAAAGDHPPGQLQRPADRQRRGGETPREDGKCAIGAPDVARSGRFAAAPLRGYAAGLLVRGAGVEGICGDPHQWNRCVKGKHARYNRAGLQAQLQRRVAAVAVAVRRRAGDRLLATMEVPNPALARFAQRHAAAGCGYPDLAERTRFWDEFLSHRAVVEDDSMPVAYLSELDQGLYGGLLGAEVQFTVDPATGWISSMAPPLLKDWSEFDRLRFDGSHPWWRRYVRQLEIFAAAGSGKWGIGHFILVDGLHFVFECRRHADVSQPR